MPWQPQTQSNENKERVNPYVFRDEATRKKIRRHISDINDVISDKDIRNAKVPGSELPPTNGNEKA